MTNEDWMTSADKDDETALRWVEEQHLLEVRETRDREVQKAIKVKRKQAQMNKTSKEVSSTEPVFDAVPNTKKFKIKCGYCKDWHEGQTRIEVLESIRDKKCNKCD